MASEFQKGSDERFAALGLTRQQVADMPADEFTRRLDAHRVAAGKATVAQSLCDRTSGFATSAKVNEALDAALAEKQLPSEKGFRIMPLLGSFGI